MKILIVAFGWPPISRIGALRPVGMAREWVSTGHIVHVLTGPGDRGGEFAPDLNDAAVASGAIVHRAPAPGIPRLTDFRAAFEKSTEELVEPVRISRTKQILAQWKRFPDQQRSWIRPAAALAKQLHTHVGFDVVWSTSPPESNLFVGRSLATIGVPWVADFRDPWADYALARWDLLSRWLLNAITARVLAPASAITCNVEGTGRSLRRATDRDVMCIRNGFDPIEITSGERVRTRTLGYFGRVYPELHRPERLWPALRVLRDRGTPWTVEMYTSPGGSGSAAIPVPADLNRWVRIHPPLPRPDALRAMGTMTALLMLALESPTGDPSVPGKFYEYVGSGRPVFTCAPSSFEMRRLPESTGTGIGAWTTDEIVHALETIETFEVCPAGRAGFTRAKCAARMVELFQSVSSAAIGSRVA
jgi:hypothetical protein